MKSKLYAILACTLFILSLTSCKEDDITPPDNTGNTVPSIYWLGSVTSDQQIVKGSLATGSQVVTNLYTTAPNTNLFVLTRDVSSKAIYWAELFIDDIAHTVTSYIYKGDTLGTAKVLLATEPRVLSNMIFNPTVRKLYYSAYDETASGDHVYSMNEDGSGIIKLFNGLVLGDVTHMALSADNQSLFFVEIPFAGSPVRKGGIYKGSFDGSAPVLLYDMAKLPFTPDSRDRFNGLVVIDTTCYISCMNDQEGMKNYILKGSATGLSPLTIALQSSPSSSADPLPVVFGLSVDKQNKYLYWLNRGMDDYNNGGSIYRAKAGVATLKPELVFKKITVLGGVYGGIDIGR